MIDNQENIMDTPQKIDSVESSKSFFNQAAWVSLFTPFVTFGITFALFKPNWHINSDCLEFYLLGAFCIQIVSLILGVVSLFGIPKHGRKFILWKAVIGILASCGMGVLSFVGMIFNAMGHNC